MPPACDTMSCSAMPHSTKRSGNLLAERDQPGVEHQVGVERDDAFGPSAARTSSASRIGRDQALGRRGGAGVAGGSTVSSAEPRRPSRGKARVDAVEQLLDALRVAVGVGRAGVEAVEARCRLQRGVLHEGDAAALDGVGDDHLAACRVRRASAPAPRANASTSWPSQRATCQPKARELRLEVAEVADLARPRCPTGSCCGRR